MMKKVYPLSTAPNNINNEGSTVEVSSIGAELCSDQTYDRMGHVKSPQDNSKKIDARIENTTDIELNPRTLSTTRVNIEIIECKDGSSKRRETSGIRIFCTHGNENVNDKNLEVGERKSKGENALKIAWRTWEFRALATSGYVIGSTLLLHGPMIICLLADGIGHSFPFAIGNISALLVALQCIINPFIYVFRFKELRQAMKKRLCCKRCNNELVSTT
ncbi:OLFR [Mytilus coruscus]|uniref:OLFR n=1 Tax=Mytilus coruscus TaxID=42192 RepID=A0A6J8CKX3_MYTCO|nr:OLFR [Mytilus coruscus]